MVAMPQTLRRTCVPLARDGQQRSRRVVYLERGVLDAETLSKHPFEFAPDRMAVCARRDEHVSREYRNTWRQLPEVEIVHLVH